MVAPFFRKAVRAAGEKGYAIRLLLDGYPEAHREERIFQAAQRNHLKAFHQLFFFSIEETFFHGGPPFSLIKLPKKDSSNDSILPRNGDLPYDHAHSFRPVIFFI